MIKRKYSTNHSRPFLISYMSIELKLMNKINKPKWKNIIMTQFMCFKVMLLKVPLKSVERKCTEEINEVHQRVYLENENRVNVQNLISPFPGLDLVPLSRLRSVAWLEQNHAALPSPRDPKSEVAFSTEVNVVQGSSHCTFGAHEGISRDLRPSPGRIHSYLPDCVDLVHVLSQGCAIAKCMWWKKPGRDDPAPSRVPWSHSLSVSCHPNCVKLISFLLVFIFS